jgi:hypothetical protein
MNKFREIAEEIKIVFSKDVYRFADSTLPLLIYLIFSFLIEKQTTYYLVLGLSVIVFILRLLHKQKFIFIFSSFGLVTLFFFINFLNQDTRSVLLPSIISGSVLLITCLGSILISKPIAAYSSAFTRKWPLEWYWHPHIKPAYRDVTLFWLFAFGGRFIFEIIAFKYTLLQFEWFKLIIGWPYTLLVLIISYMFGRWRLEKLKGPSIEEFQQNSPPPWQGQKHGF